MRDGGDARSNFGAVEEAAIGEEDAEGATAFDDEPIILPRLGSRFGKNQNALFREADAVVTGQELGGAA